MSGIAAVHQPLRHIDSYSGDVALLVDIGDLIHRPAVDSHPQLQFRVLAQLATDLQRTAHRRIHARKKGQHHSIPRWDAHQFIGRLR